MSDRKLQSGVSFYISRWVKFQEKDALGSLAFWRFNWKLFREHFNSRALRVSNARFGGKLRQLRFEPNYLDDVSELKAMWKRNEQKISEEFFSWTCLCLVHLLCLKYLLSPGGLAVRKHTKNRFINLCLLNFCSHFDLFKYIYVVSLKLYCSTAFTPIFKK